MSERIVGVVTGTRADYGLYRPILRRMVAADLKAELYVCGMHLAHEFGHSIDLIERDGFKIAERIETLLAGDTPEAVASAMRQPRCRSGYRSRTSTAASLPKARSTMRSATRSAR